jgi:hypothetical protein
MQNQNGRIRTLYELIPGQRNETSRLNRLVNLFYQKRKSQNVSWALGHFSTPGLQTPSTAEPVVSDASSQIIRT